LSRPTPSARGECPPFRVQGMRRWSRSVKGGGIGGSSALREERRALPIEAGSGAVGNMGEEGKRSMGALAPCAVGTPGRQFPRPISIISSRGFLAALITSGGRVTSGVRVSKALRSEAGVVRFMFGQTAEGTG